MSDNLATVLLAAIMMLGIVGVVCVDAWMSRQDRENDR